jgi:terminase small subunit-like protein
VAERILSELRAGRPVHDICRDDGMPCRDTVFEWIRQDREGFAGRYREARATGHGRAGYVFYTREIAEAVLAELMGGRNLTEVCGSPGMPGLTAVQSWIATDREGFTERYKAARQVGQLRQAQVAYSAETAEAVLGALMTGRPLRDICAEPDMPSAGAVQYWLLADRDGFRARYLEARTIGCLVVSTDMLSIVDDRDNDWITRQREDGSLETVLDPERVKRAELRVKTRRWLLSKMLPKQFGDRLDIAARQHASDAQRDYEREVAEMMKLIDGSSREPPGADEPRDAG